MPQILVPVFVGFFALLPNLNAQWAPLEDKDGRAVQVALDFAITDFAIGRDGTVSFVARAQRSGKEIGFQDQFDGKWKPEETPLLGGSEKVEILHTGLKLRSIGSPTGNLEGLLNDQLLRKSEAKEPRACVGLYDVIARPGSSSLQEAAILRLLGVGITFDSKGSYVAGDSFDILFVTDIPLGKMTAYFSIPAGYGGTSEASRARSNWYNSRMEAGGSLQSSTTGAESPAKK